MMERELALICALFGKHHFKTVISYPISNQKMLLKIWILISFKKYKDSNTGLIFLYVRNLVAGIVPYRNHVPSWLLPCSQPDYFITTLTVAIGCPITLSFFYIE